MEQIILEPYEYLCKIPGKNIRSQLINAFDCWLKVPKDKLDIVTEVVTMLHTASLLVDDVEDSSELRRGVPVAHMIYGVPMTINTANYVYFLALKKVNELNDPKATEVFTAELINLHLGQGMDLYWRDSQTCPTEKEYLDMVSLKTGGLFRLGVKLMQACSEVKDSTSKKCIDLVNDLGLYFQIRDDYMNLHSTEYSNNKGFCEDLTEGKFSFLITHAIRSNKVVGSQLMNILRQRTKNEDVKEYAVKLLKDTNSFEHTRKTLAKIEMRIRTTVKEMGGNDMIIALIDKLSEPFRPLLDNDKDNVNIKVDSPTTPRNSTNTTTTTTSNGKPKNLRKKVFRL